MTAARAESARREIFATLVLRGIALGGRFLFIIFAAKYMLPQDFGRFGLLAALALIIPTLVGCECYQVLLRRILQEPSRATETRRFYGAFALAGSAVSGIIGALTLVAFGWSATEVALGGVVLMLEYAGLETFRNLINERRPALSVLSIALRTGAWGVVVPGLFFAGFITAPWTFEAVLWFWLAGAVGAVLVGAPLWRQFRPHRHDLNLRRGVRKLKEVLNHSWMWVIYNASLRVIETGGRFVCVWMVSEAAGGRFTLVSMLASLSWVAQKGVVEPVYYPRLSALDANENVFRQFSRVSLAVIVGGTLCAVIGLAANGWLEGAVPPESELVSFAFLCIAFAFLSLSQPAHFRLYRQHRDQTVMLAGVTALVVMALSSVVGTWLWGIAGAAAGTMLGALVLLVTKSRAARLLKPERMSKPCTTAD